MLSFYISSHYNIPVLSQKCMVRSMPKKHLFTAIYVYIIFMKNYNVSFTIFLPGGGDKKIESRKLDWSATSKIGSTKNMKHKAGGGNVKVITLFKRAFLLYQLTPLFFLCHILTHLCSCSTCSKLFIYKARKYSLVLAGF